MQLTAAEMTKTAAVWFSTKIHQGSSNIKSMSCGEEVKLDLKTMLHQVPCDFSLQGISFCSMYLFLCLLEALRSREYQRFQQKGCQQNDIVAAYPSAEVSLG